MRPLSWLTACVLTLLLGYCLASPMAAQSNNSQQQSVPDSQSDDPVDWTQQFVPDSQLFWDNSKNWTTNYGPAYRDTIQLPSEMLACSPQFALCFHSGPEPYPCRLSPDGRSANCKCMVLTTTNYTLISAILNYPVYIATVEACHKYGHKCQATDQAPVCKYLNGGALIPGADVISTFDPKSRDDLLDALKGKKPVTVCPKAPYAGCMTAPCKINQDGSTATCKCPVFYGKFQLVKLRAQCSLGGDLVPSASYLPLLDTHPSD